MRKILAALLLSTTVAVAQPPHYAIHNGSLMQILPLPNLSVEIRYVQSRPGLNVSPGTLLIAGQWHDKELVATAFAFAYPCPPFPYEVHGTVNTDGVLTLVGKAPLVDPFSCTVIDHIWSNNATLVFVPQ
jgi:hypothetical protein